MTKYKARDVIIGAWLAFLVQTVVGVAAGSILTLLPTEPIRIVSGVGFLVFAVLALRRKEEEEICVEEQEVARQVAPSSLAGTIVQSGHLLTVRNPAYRR